MLYWKIPLPDKQENSYEWSFQLVRDSVCLHSALLNWLQSWLEMVLLLYTSHNSPLIKAGPSFIWEMTFPLGSANFLLLLCELWCWGMSVVNQHNNRISLGGASQSLGLGKAVRQMTAHPEHTQQRAHRRTLFLPPLFYPHSHSYTDKHTKIHKSDKGRQQRHRRKTELGQRDYVCQLLLTSSRVSSKVWEAHKVQLPIWQRFKFTNKEVGFFQSMAPSSLCFWLH